MNHVASPKGSVRLRLEALDDRAVPSAGYDPVVHPNYLVRPLANAGEPGGMTPAQVRRAYGFDQIANDGAGQTIAIVVAYDHPTIGQDLATFDRAFGLPDPPSFTKAVAPGTPVDPGWAAETALDVEWAHAIAPKANLLLVSAKSDGIADMVEAVDFARRQPGVTVVSMSWGARENTALAAMDRYFNTPAGHAPITFVAAAGDGGAAAEWPASSPNVLAVGGTRIRTDAAGDYLGETAWSYSGGGFSRSFATPSYQRGVVSGARGIPDVAYNADPASGVAVFNSVPDENGRSGWSVVGGTSAGAPQWSALIALANQQRAGQGKASLGRAQDSIYTLPASAFRDITAGGNGYAARVGYDLVTGRGTPVANLLVQGLSGTELPATTTNPTPAPTTGAGRTSSTGTSPIRGISGPIWSGFGWGGLFGWNLGGWPLGRTAVPVWFAF